MIVYSVAGFLGYKIPINFKQPFSSTNLIEFWRGWHASFSEFLKYAFYNPIRQFFNAPTAIICVFVASGLWHGVSLNFAIWSIYHGVSVVVTLFLLKRNFNSLSTLLFVWSVPFGRLLFCETDVTRLGKRLSNREVNLDSLWDIIHAPRHVLFALVLGCCIIITEFIFQKHELFKSRKYKFLRQPIISLCIGFLIIVFISKSSGEAYAVYGQR